MNKIMSRGDGPTSYFVGEPGFLAALEWAPLSTYTRDGGSRFAKPTKDIVFHLNKRDWGCLSANVRFGRAQDVSGFDYSDWYRQDLDLRQDRRRMRAARA